MNSISRRHALRLSIVGTAALGTSSAAFEPEQLILDKEPLTIAASTVGDFSKGESWYLSVNSAGQAELTIATIPKSTRRRFDVHKKQLDDFRKALNTEKFFELANKYGEIVPGGSKKLLTITQGQDSRTVTVQYLMHWAKNEKEKLREPCRVVRLLIMLRGWFNDAAAVDLREYDQEVLNAIK